MSVALRISRILVASGACLASALPAAAQERKEETVKIPDSNVSFDLVYLPGGKARIGSPEGEAGRKADETARDVEVRPFWIGKHEVTWEAYSVYYENWRLAKVDGITRPSQPDVCNPKEPFPGGGQQTDKHPANSLGLFGVTGFCSWLSVKTGQQFRLPTEVEWEYACRAGSADAAPAPLGDAAWYQDNSEEQTHPVGGKKPNAWGLYDMLGNVWEYCLEPCAPPDSIGVVRGGAWNTPAADVRHANRQKEMRSLWLKIDPKRPVRPWWLTDAPFVGFRLVRLPDDGATKEERAAAAGKLAIANLKLVDKGKPPLHMARVTGEIAYAGDRPLDEVEVLVYYLDEEGKPLIKDPKDKPAYNACYPALLNSARPGPPAKPFAPGETRTFELEVPHPFDEVGPLELDKVGAKVTRIHFAPK